MKMHERYMNDPKFHALVDMILSVIMNGEFTPTEIREAAMLAQIRYEEIKPRQTAFTIEDIQRGKV